MGINGLEWNKKDYYAIMDRHGCKREPSPDWWPGLHPLTSGCSLDTWAQRAILRVQTSLKHRQMTSRPGAIVDFAI